MTPECLASWEIIGAKREQSHPELYDASFYTSFNSWQWQSAFLYFIQICKLKNMFELYRRQLLWWLKRPYVRFMDVFCPQAKGSLSLSGFHVYFVCKYRIPEALGLLGEGIKDPWVKDWLWVSCLVYDTASQCCLAKRHDNTESEHSVR